MTELVNIAEEVRQLFLSMTEEMLEAEEKSEPLSVPSCEEDTEESERSLTGQREHGGENEGYTQEKLELIMEDAGAATEDTAEAPEETEKERARRLKPEKLEKKFRELQATGRISGTSGECGKTGAFSASVPPQDQSGISEYR